MTSANTWALRAPPIPRPLGPLLRRTTISTITAPAIFSCRCSGGGVSGGKYTDWDWIRWNQHFSDTDRAEQFSSVLKVQLEDAIKNEDYFEACRLREAIAEATSTDIVAEVSSELKSAIEEERYQDASRLRDLTGNGLIGWWAGWSEDSDNPYGRIIRISPAVGRYVARIYNPRQLLTASLGTPFFEIFLVKDDTGTYVLKVVLLEPVKESVKIYPSSPLVAPIMDVERWQMLKKPSNEDAVEKIKEDHGEKSNGDPVEKDGLKNVFDFLKGRLPGFKDKTSKADMPENNNVGTESSKKSVKEDDEKTVQAKDVKNENAINHDKIIRNKEEARSKPFVRCPAEMNCCDKDLFVLHIPGRYSYPDVKERTAARLKVTALAAQSASDLMTSEIAKAFWGAEEASSKVTKDVREVLNLAVSQAQRMKKLTETTTFHRIITDNDGLDPFDGLYIGSFGPHGSEVVQLHRKYGHWTNTDKADSGIEFFEYVEAVKLTGDLNVPAGEVTFRAKIGKGARISNRGNYPEEFGVVASYKGQGKIAEPGFENPRWVDGELLQLNGKGVGPQMRKADLGFLYTVPERSFLVLFHRLQLPE